MIRRILFVNPPNIVTPSAIKRLNEPLGLLYVGTSAVEEGYEVEIYDMACEGYNIERPLDGMIIFGTGEEDLGDKIREFEPDLVAITCPFFYLEDIVIQLTDLVKRLSPTLPVVVGGIHPSTAVGYKYLMENSKIDYILLGECEWKFLNLLECLNNNGETDRLSGLISRKNGEINVSSGLSRVSQLDNLNVDRGLVDMEKYFKAGTPMAPFATSGRTISTVWTRGCPWKCSFCASVKFWGRHIRQRSFDHIIAEVEDSIDRFGIEEIQITDDNFSVDRTFVTKLLKKLVPYKLKFMPANGLSVHSLNKEIIDLLADAGFYQISLAVESGSPRVLRACMNKEVPLERVPDLVRYAQSRGIYVHGMFILGMPGEMDEDRKMTFDFPYQAGFDSISLFQAVALPGSDLYKFCAMNGFLSSNRLSNFQVSNIEIPPSSELYFDRDKLAEDIVANLTKFNEWVKNKDPDRYFKRFEPYLKRHPEHREKVHGRVT